MNSRRPNLLLGSAVILVVLVSGCVQPNPLASSGDGSQSTTLDENQGATDANEADTNDSNEEDQTTATQGETRLITANPLDLEQVARLSKFRSCVGHDYSGLNAQGERETLRSMKHYVEPVQELAGTIDKVKAFAPFDGRVSEVRTEERGSGVYVSADSSPSWNFIFFHVNLLPGIKQGTSVKAGQLMGYAALEGSPNFDFALKQFGIGGQVFDAPFNNMSDSIVAEYAAKNVTLENAVILKAERDSNPCEVEGEIQGDAMFAGHRDEDFVQVNP